MSLLATALVVLSVSLVPVVLAGSADVGIEPAYPVEGNTRSSSIFIMMLKPETTGTNGIRLINSGKDAHTVKIYPVDAASSVSGSFSCRQQAEARKQVGSWVTLSKDTLTLEPGAQEVVDFTVVVPKGTSPGEHNGCIAVQDLASLPAKTGEGILLGFRSAIRLAVTVPGKIVKKLSFLRVDVTRTKDGNYQVSPVAKNTGNVSLDVKSYAQLESIFGQKTPVKSDSTCPIIPGSTTTCGYTFERPYWGGLYMAHISLSYNADPKDGLGQAVNNQTRFRKDSAYFFALPDPLAGLAELAVVAILLWFIITPFRRRIRRKRIVRKWEKYIVVEGDTIMAIAAARGAKWRRIVRFNHLRAPYALQAGQVIIAPKVREAKLRKIKKRKHRSELDWVLDTEKSVTAESAETEVAQDTSNTPTPEGTDFVSPREQAQRTAIETSVRPDSSVQPRARSQPSNNWINPVYTPPEEADTYDEDFVDWRDGADPDELEKIESRLGDYRSMPSLRSQIVESSETMERKTSPQKKRPTKTKTKPVTKPKKRS